MFLTSKNKVMFDSDILFFILMFIAFGGWSLLGWMIPKKRN